PPVYPSSPALPPFPTRRSSDLVIGLAASGTEVTFEQFGSIGYVDDSSVEVLAESIPAPDYPDLFQRFDEEETARAALDAGEIGGDRKSTRLNSSHVKSSYAVFR